MVEEGYDVYEEGIKNSYFAHIMVKHMLMRFSLRPVLFIYQRKVQEWWMSKTSSWWLGAVYLMI